MTEVVEVVLERPRSERIVLADTATTRLLAMAEEGRLSPELRAAMTKAAGLRTELDRRNAAVHGLVRQQETQLATLQAQADAARRAADEADAARTNTLPY